MNRSVDVLARIRELPALPTGAGQLILLLQDPEIEIAELIRRIEYDPGLTTNLLRLANSSYFAGPRAIASIQEAVVRLGTRRIFQLVVASAVAPLARRPVLGYDLSAGELLEHSVAVAVGAEQLAAVLGVAAHEHLFTAGLLHDLGKIVLGSFVRLDAAPIKTLAIEEGLPFDEAERRILGTDHAHVGAILLREWGLPASMAEVVRHHHRPDASPEPSAMLDLVHAADGLVLSGGIGGGLEGLNYEVSERVAERLGLTPNAEEAALARTLEALEDLRGAFV